MKFGLFYQLPCADWQSPVQRYKETLEQIQLGDELGFDRAWLAELHFNSQFSITPSPLMVAAAAAQCTSRIRLGVAVNLLSLHNPIRIAEDIATLDIISDGRAEFGVGRGVIPSHFHGFNVDQEENRDRFLEVLDFVIKAWTQEELSYEGKYFSTKGLCLVPKPVQKPHPPVRIAANSADTFELVGNLGYSMLATPVIVPMSRIREGVKVYRERLAANGQPINGDELSLALPVFVSDSDEEAKNVPEASVTNYLNCLKANTATYSTGTGAPNPRAAETQDRFANMSYDVWYDEVAVFGDTTRCVEKLQALQDEFQPGEYVCWFNQGGLIDHSRVMEAMKMFAEKVMPRFR